MEKFEGDFKGFIEKTITEAKGMSNYDLVNQYGNFCLFLPYFHGEDEKENNELIMKAAQAYQMEILSRMEGANASKED